LETVEGGAAVLEDDEDAIVEDGKMKVSKRMK